MDTIEELTNVEVVMLLWNGKLTVGDTASPPSSEANKLCVTTPELDPKGK